MALQMRWEQGCGARRQDDVYYRAMLWPRGTHIMRPLVHVEPTSSLSLSALSLSLSLFSLISLFFIIFFFALFCSFLFSKEELAPSLVRNEPVAGCSPISPTLGLLCLTTPKAKCVMSVSPSIFRQLEVPGVQLVQFSCPHASYASRPENG